MAASSELQLDFCFSIAVTGRVVQSWLALNSARASSTPDVASWLFYKHGFPVSAGSDSPFTFSFLQTVFLG